jgi:hypothetical protein
MTIVAILAIIPTQSNSESRAVVCHYPGGSFVTLAVDGAALDAHLAHGDVRGACEVPASSRCDDGNPCTVDAYLPGTVLCDPQPVAPNCSDGILCTNDTCDPDRGCVSTVTCGPEAPVCDPTATDPSAACTGGYGECPLSGIADLNGWDDREVENVQCAEIRGFGTFQVRAREARESAALCGDGNQDISCCEEACDCTCAAPTGFTIVVSNHGSSGDEHPRVSHTISARNGDPHTFEWVDFESDDDGSSAEACRALFDSPDAAASCLEGICTAPRADETP